MCALSEIASKRALRADAPRQPASKANSQPKPSRSLNTITSPTSTRAPLSFDSYERMAIERVLAESDGDPIAAARQLKLGKSTMYLRMGKFGIRTLARGAAIAISDHDPLVGTGESLSRDAYEKAAILRALEECGDDMAVAAKALRVGRSTLYRRMAALGIPRRRQVRKHILTPARRS